MSGYDSVNRHVSSRVRKVVRDEVISYGLKSHDGAGLQLFFVVVGVQVEASLSWQYLVSLFLHLYSSMQGRPSAARSWVVEDLPLGWISEAKCLLVDHACVSSLEVVAPAGLGGTEMFSVCDAIVQITIDQSCQLRLLQVTNNEKSERTETET